MPRNSFQAWNDTPPANSTFLKVYPQFDLTGINNLEALFLAHIQWNSYPFPFLSNRSRFVTGSLYAKYYFAIRALDENERFKQKHWYMKHICKFSDSPSPSSRKSSYSVFIHSLLIEGYRNPKSCLRMIISPCLFNNVVYCQSFKFCFVFQTQHKRT